MSPGRRSLYLSLGLILVLIHVTAAYSVEEICSRRCLYHRGGVLCNCNARHFTGKRSGLAAGMHTARSARRGHVSPTNTHYDHSLVSESEGTPGIHFATSQGLQQQMRHLWGRHRVGHQGQDLDQQVGNTVDEGTDDQYKDNIADLHIDDPSEVMLQQDVGDDDIDNVRTVGRDEQYTVVSGNDDAVQTRVASHLRQLQAALGQALQGRRRSRLD
ncbi:hypothetical protein BsWGS_25866 [Bradybaena similaris]